MRPLVRLIAAGVFLLASIVSARGDSAPVCAQTQASAAPCIAGIDPPNWWSGFPDPMLLVHGAHLDHAHFTVDGRGIVLKRAQASANGHWAFLWLDTHAAAAQTLRIVAGNAHGKAHGDYVLAERSFSPSAHAGFSSRDAMYLLMPDRFADGNPAGDPPGDDRAATRGWHGGNFAGVEQHLDYLQQLGVTALWMTPVVSNAGMKDSYHGYAATNLYAVDPHFGTLADYRHLADALHARGMKLIFDAVPNHIGIKHPWVLDPPAPQWLHGTPAHHAAIGDDFSQLADPHAPPRAWRNIVDGWFTDQMPDLNQENPLVAQYLIQNALWWVETAHLDGLRLDTFPYVSRAFWQQYHAALHATFPHLTTVGEIFDADPQIVSYFAGGRAHNGIDTGLDTPFDFPVYFALRGVLAHGQPMTTLAHVLAQDALYPHPDRLVTFIGNHDTERFLTAAGGSIPRLEMALGLLATLRGMPLVYSGDEIAMNGGKDPDNRRDFPGGFPGDAQNAFTAAGRTATENEVFNWTSGLLKLRAAEPALQTGIEQNLFADADGFAFVRTLAPAGCAADHSREELLIVVNKAARTKPFALPTAGTALDGCRDFRPLAPTHGGTAVRERDALHLEEPAQSLTIYAVR